MSQTNPKIAIVGSPNVGKSVLFGALTDSYVTVSNYPGTTVEISQAKAHLNGTEFDVIDTPGLYNLFTITEEEKVSRNVIFAEKPDLLIHVIDAKNIERMLPLTLQLREAGIPIMLVANMLDEAEKSGTEIDFKQLSEELSIPVVGTILTKKRGLDDVKSLILQTINSTTQQKLRLPSEFTDAIDSISELMIADYGVEKSVIANLALQGDADIVTLITHKELKNHEEILKILDAEKTKSKEPIQYLISMARFQSAKDIVARVVTTSDSQKSISLFLSRLTMKPLTGLPILAVILYYGVYKFVGGFGAGTLVDYLENVFFFEMVLPPVETFINSAVPWENVRNLIVGEYGLFTLGIRYAFVVILPIVATFFIAFAIIEDSGYLPRLAMLLDRLFKRIGLSGRAVIPMVLGLGCDTMATIVTRTLPSKRERVISTLLLSLAVPCSAQLGVILGILSVSTAAFGVWVGTIGLVFMLIGWMAAKIMPGEKAIFFMEVPPLRLPRFGNVMVKTLSRMQWYFKEVFPVFIAASLLLWFFELTGVMEFLIGALKSPMEWLNLPQDAAQVFLYGFFRRDYGAAGLYDLNEAGLLTSLQLVVAAVTLTLFLPCIAQFIINIKERGMKVGISMSAFVFVFAFIVGIGLSNFLGVINIL